MLSIPGARIEMLEINSKDVYQRMTRFLENHGEGIGGLSIFVEDFDAEVKALKDNGFAVKVQPGKLLDKYPFRLAWVEADEGHGKVVIDGDNLGNILEHAGVGSIRYQCTIDVNVINVPAFFVSIPVCD